MEKQINLEFKILSITHFLSTLNICFFCLALFFATQVKMMTQKEDTLAYVSIIPSTMYYSHWFSWELCMWKDCIIRLD